MGTVSTDLVIILSSDWVGSTATRAQLGEEPADALQEVHDTLLRRVIATAGGTVVKHYGDGVLATFNSATAALGAAVKIQQDFAASRASPDALARMDLRIGLSAGDIKHQAGDIFGLPVVEAVRLQSAAAPNEILCSDLVRVLSQGRGGFQFEDAGLLELKGLPAPVRALWVRAGSQTPAGSVYVSPAVAPSPPAPGTSRKRGLVAAAVLALAVVALLADRWLREDTPVVDPQAIEQAVPPVAVDATEAMQPEPPSIAVLPFTNMSSDPEQEYFSDGLSEELLNQLAHLPNLRVIGRTSSFAFKGKSEDLRTIGETLGVNHILEGSVRKAGNRLRIMAQLINPADGSHLWSEAYDRDLDDVFAIQEEIAKAVATALEITLGVGELSQAPGMTRNVAAYEHYLRGHILSGSVVGREVALAAAEEFRRALAIDPDYAQAWAGLAIILSTLLSLTPDDAMQHEREREEATRRALAIAPDLPLALTAKMWLHMDRREWIPADEACASVFAAARDHNAVGRCAGFLIGTGRVRSALPYRQAAHRTDPLSELFTFTQAWIYVLLDMGEEFTREYERTQKLYGRSWNYEGLMLTHLMQSGSPSDVIVDQLERMCTVLVVPRYCNDLLEASRSPDKAAVVLHRLLETIPAIGIDVAHWAAYFGERDLALDALEVSLSRNASGPALQNIWSPLLSDARQDPRFKAMVRDIGFVDLWRATGNWADACQPVGADDFECH